MRFESQADVHSPKAGANRDAHLAMLAEVRALEQKVRDASNRARAKFERRSQLLPRDRIAQLLDRGTPFVELSTLAGYKMHDDDGDANIAGGGVISGIGFVSGVRCVVSASDAGIRGGAATPMGIRKGLRGQRIAMENKLPMVQMVESAGANLFRQSELFVEGGETFANMARMSAMGLPTISVVNGSSTAGGAYQTGLSDYVVLVRGRSRVYLAGPPLLKAATGEIAEEEDLGGAEMHTLIPGTGEYLAEDDADGIRIARRIVAQLGWNKGKPAIPRDEVKPPIYDAEEILSIVPADYRTPYEVRELIARLVDGSEILDFKPAWGPHTVTVHAAIGGHPVGIISNNGPIDANGAAKAAQFIQLCSQSGTPLIFLQNTTGFLVGTEAEQSGIVKHGSKFIQAMTNAPVPRITINIGASFGAGYYAMCGRGFAPRFLFGWPSHRISVMGGEQAAKTMTIVAEDAAARRGEEPNRAYFDAVAANVVKTYEEEAMALFATARLWDDGLIDPRDTRKALIFCLDTCHEEQERKLNPSTFGVSRF